MWRRVWSSRRSSRKWMLFISVCPARIIIRRRPYYWKFAQAGRVGRLMPLQQKQCWRDADRQTLESLLSDQPASEWNEGGCQLLRRPVFRKEKQQNDWAVHCRAELKSFLDWQFNSCVYFHGPSVIIGKSVPYHWQCQSQLQSQQLHTTNISARKP